MEALRLDTVQGGDSLGPSLAHTSGEVEVADRFVDGGVAVGGFLSVIVGNAGGSGAICSSESESEELEEAPGVSESESESESVSELSESESTGFFRFFFAAATAASSSSFFLDCLEALPALAMALVDSTSLRLRLPGSCMSAGTSTFFDFLATFCIVVAAVAW